MKGTKAGRLNGKDGRIEGKDGRIEGKDGGLEGRDGRIGFFPPLCDSFRLPSFQLSSLSFPPSGLPAFLFCLSAFPPYQRQSRSGT